MSLSASLKAILAAAKVHSAQDGEEFVVVGRSTWGALIEYVEGARSEPPVSLDCESSIQLKWGENLVLKPQVFEGSYGVLPQKQYNQLANLIKQEGERATRTAKQMGLNIRVELHPIAIQLSVIAKGTHSPLEQRHLLCSRHSASIRALVEDACTQASITPDNWRIISVSVCHLEQLNPPAVADDWDWKSAALPQPAAFQIIRETAANTHPDEANWPRMVSLRVVVMPLSNSARVDRLWPDIGSAAHRATTSRVPNAHSAAAAVGGHKRPLSTAPGDMPILPIYVSPGSKRARGLMQAAASKAALPSPRGGAFQPLPPLPRSAGSSSSDNSDDDIDSPRGIRIPLPQTGGGLDPDSDADSGIDGGGGGLGSSRLAAQLLDDGSLLPRSNGWSSSEKLPAGCTGLSNLGNTCFMNAALQCLSNTPLLTAYLLRGDYELDVNKDNPLGHSGRIILAFAKLVRSLWAGGFSDPRQAAMQVGHMLQQQFDTHGLLQDVLARKGANGDKSLPQLPVATKSLTQVAIAGAGGGAVAPGALKYAVATVAPQFGGYQQHDSQELLSFLLDGLHEDVNKITSKPYVEVPSGREGRDDNSTLAASVWSAYAKRNDSIITELFQGQYRSRVQCTTPGCTHVSLTFDPYSSLSLPLPTVQRHVRFDCTVLDVGAAIKVTKSESVSKLYYGHLVPSAHSVLLPEGSKVNEAIAALAKQLEVDPTRLIPAQTTGTGAKLLQQRASAPCVGVRDRFDGEGGISSLSSLATAAASRIVVYQLPKHAVEAADADIVFALQRRSAAQPADTAQGAAAVSVTSSIARGFAARQAAAFGSLGASVVDKQVSSDMKDALARDQTAKSGRLSLLPKGRPVASLPGMEQSATVGSGEDEAEGMGNVEDALGSVKSDAAVEMSASPSGSTATKSPTLSPQSPEAPPADNGGDDSSQGGHSDSPQPILWRFVMLNIHHRRQLRSASPGAIMAGAHSIGYPAILPVIVASQPIADEVLRDVLPIAVRHLPRLSEYQHMVQLAERWIAPLPPLGGQGQSATAAGAGLPSFLMQTSDSASAPLHTLSGPKAAERTLWELCGCGAPEAAATHATIPAGPKRGVFGTGLNGGQALPAAASLFDDDSEESDEDDLFGTSSSSWRKPHRTQASSARRWSGLRNFQTSPTLCIVWPAEASFAVQPLLRPLLPPGDNTPAHDSSGQPAAASWPKRVPRAMCSDTSTRIPGASSGGVTLSDCMQLWESEEQLGDSDTWYCSECKQHVRALKRLSLWSAPQYLMVHLKRFKFSAFSRARINTRVHFPISGWDLSGHFLEQEASVHANGSVYDLYAVINHMGSMGGGHYTACAKHPLTDMWFDFDDSSVSSMGSSTSDRVQQRLTSSQAYVLFYARRSTQAQTDA